MEKTKLKDLPKGKRIRRIIGGFFAGFLCILLLFLLITTAITYIGYSSSMKLTEKIPNAGCKQLELEKDAKGFWNIKSDEDLKVMQLTDVHIGGGWLSIRKDFKAIMAVASMVTAEKPDLVVVTGDVSYPMPFSSGTTDNRISAKIFANLMERLGVYWTLCYGNHDSEPYSLYHHKTLNEVYTASENAHCLFQEGPENADGYGNQIINIKNSDGIITRSLVLLDSHGNAEDDTFGIYWHYDNIHKNQVDWYETSIKELESNNKKLIDGFSAEKQAEYKGMETIRHSLFFHIPLREYRNAWNDFAKNDYKNTADSEFMFGKAGESGAVVFCGIGEDEVFETAQRLGGADSMFCGHDHYNNFSIKHKGIQLTYGMSIDYLAYAGISKMGSQRGCTLIDYGKKGDYKIQQENYYQDKYQHYLQKEPEKATLQYENQTGVVSVTGVNNDPRLKLESSQ